MIYLWLYDGEVMGVGRTDKLAEQRGLSVLAGYAQVFRTLDPESPDPSPEDVAKRLEWVKQRAQCVPYKAAVKLSKADEAQCDALMIRAIAGLLPAAEEMQDAEDGDGRETETAADAIAAPARASAESTVEAAVS